MKDKDLSPDDLADLVGRAEHGDDDAIRQACRIAAKALKAHKHPDPFIARYISGSLSRIADGSPLKASFSPAGRVAPKVIMERRELNDLAVLHWVDYAIERLGMATSNDGDPGPAFERVADQWGLSPFTVRNRYYSAKRRITEKCKSRITR